MLARYTIHRGKRPADDPLPDGIRQDTRKHTRHVLRPPAEAVARYLADPSAAEWSRLRKDYLEILDRRFAEDRSRFDRLAELASGQDVYLGCNCPTRKNPDVSRCHTFPALRFMKKKYPRLDVRLPPGGVAAGPAPRR